MAVSGRKIDDFQGSISKGSAEDFDHRCEPCLAIGQEKETHGYCVDCHENLCTICYAYHQRTKASKHHQLVNKDQMAKHVIPATDSGVCTEMCLNHKNEVIKFFCQKHEALGCNDCMTMDHRTCDIDYIPDKCSGIGDSAEFREVMRELDRKVNDAEEVKKQASCREKKLESYYDKLLQEITKFRKEIKDRLDQLHNQIQTDADTKKAADKQIIKEVLETCTGISSDIKQLQSRLQGYKDLQQNAQLYITMKQAKSLQKNDIKEADRSLEKTNLQYTFEQNQDLKNMLSRQSAFGKLALSFSLVTTKLGEPIEKCTHEGNINTSQNAIGEHALHSLVTTKGRKSIEKFTHEGNMLSRQNALGKFALSSLVTTKGRKPIEKFTHISTRQSAIGELSLHSLVTTEGRKSIEKLTFKGNINIKTKSDQKESWIRGCVVPSSYKLVVADYNNEKLKVVDMKNKSVIEEKTLSSKPWDIAVMPQDQLAVTMPDKKEIHIMTTARKLSTVRKFPVKGACRGIDYHQDHLYILCRDPKCVFITDAQGNLKNTITLDNKGFLNPYYLMLSKDLKKILISDWDKNSVVSITLQGDISAVYKDFRYPPLGIVMLDDGSLLVCCSGSNGSIRHISGDFNECYKMIDGLTYPESLCCNHNQDEVYIGCENDHITVLSIN